MTDTFPAGEQTHLAPRLGQQNRRTQDQKDDSHDRENDQQSFLTEPPASLRKLLKHPVVTPTDRKKMRHVLRSHHRAITRRSRPIVSIWTFIRAFRDPLP